MVYLATYTGRGSLVNALIRFWTNSDASHSEIVIAGCGYSSSIMDKGVRCKRIDFNDGKWELLPLRWVRSNDIIQYFAATQKHKYGFKDLLCRQFMHFPCGDSPNQFCSEWCAAAIGLKSGREFSPALLRDVIADIIDIVENR